MNRFINITADGKTIQALPGQTLLDALLDAGFNIPHLCHNKYLEAYGGCGLCLVELEGGRKPVRSCSTMPTEGMVITTQSPRINQARQVALGLLLSDHRGDCRPPCYNACPTHQDCQGYIGLAAQGKFEEAIRLIKQDNPLPACIGRVCPHPCEEACRRQLVEEPLSIARIKQAVADLDLDKNQNYLPEKAPATGKRVAIVGAGPAGLTAAWFLAIAGHDVEIFEAMPAPGGMLRYGIPAYRLPKSVVDNEVEVICSLGVKITYNTRLGRDITLEGLKSKYDAVFVAVGAWQSSPLGVENDNLPGVLGGIDFLADIACGKRPEIGSRVAVVGGGNTAIDAVRSALRLGAKDVYLIYRRTRAEMPAEDIEIEEAEEEGVKFKFLCTPSTVLQQNGRAVGLRLQKMRLGEPDASGRRRPEPIEGEVEDMHFDTIISAIGQKVRPDGLEGLEMHRWKTIKADTGTFATNMEGVFAGGDAINDGPGIAVSAISHGKFAAQAIDSYLKGELKPVIQPFLVKQDNITRADLPEVETMLRVKNPVTAPEARIKNFNETTMGFTEQELKKEASRCLECGCCSLYDCELLPLLQKYDAQALAIQGRARKTEPDHSNPFIWRDNNKCVLCGLCVRVCKEQVQVCALEFNGRGFDASPQPAFDWNLAQSNCTSCGNCVAICPTGALQERHPFAKTPPLPLEKQIVNCSYCERGCKFELHSFGTQLQKAIPADPSEHCSIGRFGLVLKGVADFTETQAESVIKALNGDLEKFMGTKPDISTKARLEAFLSK